MTIETANRLYELRKEKGLSQEELAEKLGVSRQAVSKWERSEASPDTDNLIALAKIYSLSLDELIYGEKSEKGEQSANEQIANEQSANEQDTNEQGEELKTAKSEPLYTVEDEDNRVEIHSDCILIEDEKGKTVKIGMNGLRIETEDPDEGEDVFDISLNPTVVVDENGRVNINVRKDGKVRFWLKVPYPLLCVIAYLIFGFYNVCGGWGHSWIVFVTIPIYYTLVEAIYNRKWSDFAFPVLCAFIYLYLGLYQGNWHPSWIVFITIPIYYPIAEAIDKKRKSKQK